MRLLNIVHRASCMVHGAWCMVYAQSSVRGCRCHTAQLQKATQIRDLVIASKCVATLLWNREGHLVAIQDHLQVILLGFFAQGAKSLEHVHDLTPVNVVRGGMGEKLLQCFLGAVAHSVTPCQHCDRFSSRKMDATKVLFQCIATSARLLANAPELPHHQQRGKP